MIKKVLAAFAVVVLVAGCGGPEPDMPQAVAKKPDISKIEVSGDPSDPVNKLAVDAIADLQDYWGTNFPELYDKDYEPVGGGFYAVTPSSGDLPPCAIDPSEIWGNAFYCASKDVVAWDAEGLLPDLQSRFGDFVIPVVLAHEWGHAVQGRSNFAARTVTKELQADCFAGAWSKHAQDDKVFDVSSADLNVEAMPSVYEQGGDYAVATLLATQYGLAALTRLGDDSDEKTSTARGDCLAGAYTASVILYNRPDTSTYHISPGDLDEGIKALLVFRGSGDADRQGAGFDRVRAFREGVINGAQSCMEYKA